MITSPTGNQKQNRQHRHYRVQFALALACLLLSLGSFAGKRDSTNTSAVKKADYFIDDDQKRIDLLDGNADGRVELADSLNTAVATRVYIQLVDSIQGLIDGPQFDEAHRKIYRENLFLQLHRVSARNVHAVKRYANYFQFVIAGLHAVKQKKLYSVLNTNIYQSFNVLPFFKRDAGVDSFLIFASTYRPDLVLKNYPLYSKEDYALHVVEEASKAAPVTVKRYFNPNDPIYLALKTSNDTVIKVILSIKDKLSRKTNAFTLIDDIVKGRKTLEEADEIGNDPEKYLQCMIDIRTRPNPMGVYSLESELEIYALKFVRVVNDLHNETDAVRFASVEKFTPEQLYTLMIYSEEEIFTSTFNGLFTRMMQKLGAVSGYEFLKNVGDNRFRTFIKMCAGFGKLRPFLQSMTALHQQMLMIKFASGLEVYNDLSQAVEVADAFGSITDSLVLKILRSTIKIEYIRLTGKNNQRGMTIYGLLSNLFVDRAIGNRNWFSSVAEQYALPSFDRINNEKLFDRDGINRWLIYFYDDEDGEASFATFLKTFKDPNWAIADSGMYVIIRSKKGTAVDIYANKPKNEYDGQAKLEAIFAENEYEPNVMVHRGHSYYASKTIEKIRDNTQVFVLGSCGGYHSISSIIERSSDVSIISSKQIGTMFVNNPMLKLIAEDIRQSNDVNWQYVWERLEGTVKTNPKAYERFQDYIPPHKNLGAIFIKTYNKLVETQM